MVYQKTERIKARKTMGHLRKNLACQTILQNFDKTSTPEKSKLILALKFLFPLLSGVNLRTGKRGIFPSAYATDLSFLAVQDDGGTHSMRFYLQFLGSIQVNYSRGTEVLQQAINKVLRSMCASKVCLDK